MAIAKVGASDGCGTVTVCVEGVVDLLRRRSRVLERIREAIDNDQVEADEKLEWIEAHLDSCGY